LTPANHFSLNTMYTVKGAGAVQYICAVWFSKRCLVGTNPCFAATARQTGGRNYSMQPSWYSHQNKGSFTQKRLIKTDFGLLGCELPGRKSVRHWWTGSRPFALSIHSHRLFWSVKTDRNRQIHLSPCRTVSTFCRLSSCVCMYVCMYVLCTCVCMCMNVLCTYVCMYVCVCMYMCMCTYDVYMYVCVCVISTSLYLHPSIFMFTDLSSCLVAIGIHPSIPLPIPPSLYQYQNKEIKETESWQWVLHHIAINDSSLNDTESVKRTNMCRMCISTSELICVSFRILSYRRGSVCLSVHLS
jgi:hypothetical protein